MPTLQYALCRSVQILIGTDDITVDDDQSGNADGERVVESRPIGASAAATAGRLLHGRDGSVVCAARTAGERRAPARSHTHPRRTTRSHDGTTR